MLGSQGISQGSSKGSSLARVGQKLRVYRVPINTGIMGMDAPHYCFTLNDGPYIGYYPQGTFDGKRVGAKDGELRIPDPRPTFVSGKRPGDVQMIRKITVTKDIADRLNQFVIGGEKTDDKGNNFVSYTCEKFTYSMLSFGGDNNFNCQSFVTRYLNIDLEMLVSPPGQIAAGSKSRRNIRKKSKRTRNTSKRTRRSRKTRRYRRSKKLKGGGAKRGAEYPPFNQRCTKYHRCSDGTHVCSVPYKEACPPEVPVQRRPRRVGFR